LYEGNAFRRVAAHNAPHKYVQFADRDPFIRLDRARSLERLTKTKDRSRLQIWLRRKPIRPLRNWVVRGHISLCQCSKKTSLSVPLVFTAKRSAHSPRNRLNW